MWGKMRWAGLGLYGGEGVLVTMANPLLMFVFVGLIFQDDHGWENIEVGDCHGGLHMSNEDLQRC